MYSSIDMLHSKHIHNDNGDVLQYLRYFESVTNIWGNIYHASATV